MYLYVNLMSQVDKFYLPRRVKKGVKIGSAGQKPHVGWLVGLGKRFGYSPAGLERPAGDRIRKKKTKNIPSLFEKKRNKK